MYGKKTKKKVIEFPTGQQLETELKRIKRKRRYNSVVRSTVFTLITVAAIAVLIATLWMPVLQTYGSSMTPTLEPGQIMIAIKTKNFKPGDIIAFQYNSNKVLIKRYIAGPGQYVNIDKDGNVYVDGNQLDEPYISEKALGNCDIEFPFQVPESKIFVMGDHRSVSIDSRSTSIGCISKDQIVGKIVFCVWPFKKMGKVS